jgi:hypothetical protein
MTNTLPAARLAIHVIASLGVSKVINDVISNNTNVVTSADAVKVWTGSIVLGSLIAEHASKHVDARVNSVLAWNEARKAAQTVPE